MARRFSPMRPTSPRYWPKKIASETQWTSREGATITNTCSPPILRLLLSQLGMQWRCVGRNRNLDHSRRIEKSDVGVAVRTRIAPTAPPVRADVDVILLRRIRS